VEEMARFGAWEYTANQLSDYDQGQHGRLFFNSWKKITQDQNKRFQNLDSTNTTSSMNILLNLINPYQGLASGKVYATGLQFSMPMGLSLSSNISGKAIKALGSMSSNGGSSFTPGSVMTDYDSGSRGILGKFGFNSSGMVVSVARIGLKNKLIPTNFLQSFYGQKHLQSNHKHIGVWGFNFLLADDWHLNDGRDIKLPGVIHSSGGDPPYFKQVNRMAFLGMGRYINRIDSMLKVLQKEFFNFQSPISTRMVSLNYRGDPDSGMVTLPVDGGRSKFDTSPMRVDVRRESSKYYQTFMKRGKYFMGCKKSGKRPCQYK